jgi:hypothetical protein
LTTPPNGPFGGGGIYNLGAVTISTSILSGSVANVGGGITNLGTLTVTGSILNGNSADLFGGGIRNYNTGTVRITDCLLSNNASSVGGGIDNLGTLTRNPAITPAGEWTWPSRSLPRPGMMSC